MPRKAARPAGLTRRPAGRPSARAPKSEAVSGRADLALVPPQREHSRDSGAEEEHGGQLRHRDAVGEVRAVRSADALEPGDVRREVISERVLLVEGVLEVTGVPERVAGGDGE